MKKRRNQVGMWCVIAAVVGFSSASAHETDQFTLPEGRAFADLGRHFNVWVYETIDRGVKKTNQHIARVAKSGAALAEAQSPERIARAVYDEFPNAYEVIEGIDGLAASKSMMDQYPGKVVGYKEQFTNIYQHAHFPLDPRQVFRIWHAATVMVYGTYLGGDKIGHFTDMGMYYYKAYRQEIRKGGDEKAGLAAALEVGSHGLIFSERGMLGYLSAGDYSNSDMASNYLGLLFYRNLTEPVMLKGSMQPPMLVRDGDLWKLAPHVRRDSDFFHVFISDHFDEALNPGLFESGMRSDIREAVKKRSEVVLNRRCDQHGNRRPKAYFDQLLQEMRTYYGQDYGYDGKAADLISIGNTCFEAFGPNAAVLSRNAQGYTPLHAAAADGDALAVRQLIDRGADVNATVRSSENYSPEWGNTPLHYACRAGSIETAEALLAAGARINAANDRGQTPLHRALAKPQLVAMLIEKGARVNVADSRNQTALHWAAMDGQTESAALVLKHGADINARDILGETPLHFACRSGAAGVAVALLDGGADVGAKASLDTTPLHVAAANGNPELIKALLAHKADLRLRDEFGWTPLHAAACYGRHEAVSPLLSAGAEVNAGDAHGTTPLHLACRNGRDTTVSALLAKAADVSARNDSGVTPLHEASSNGNPQLLTALISRGADTGARTATGLTPLDVALRKKHRDAAALLRATPSLASGSR